MRMQRWLRTWTFLMSGVCLLQLGSCSSSAFFDFTQTVFLGITAAGAIAILQNI